MRRRLRAPQVAELNITQQSSTTPEPRWPWRTGEVAWKERGFPGAQCLYADGELIFVEEGGQIALTRVSPWGLEVLATRALLEPVAWTVRRWVGSTLFCGTASASWRWIWRGVLILGSEHVDARLWSVWAYGSAADRDHS